MSNLIVEKEAGLLVNPEKLEEKARHPWIKGLLALKNCGFLMFLTPFSLYLLNPAIEFVWVMAYGIFVLPSTLLFCMAGFQVTQNLVFKKLGLNTSAGLMWGGYSDRQKLDLIEKLEKFKDIFDPQTYKRLLSVLRTPPKSLLWWVNFQGLLEVAEEEFKKQQAQLEEEALEDDVEDQIRILKGLTFQDQNKAIAFETSILSTEKLAPLSSLYTDKG